MDLMSLIFAMDNMRAAIKAMCGEIDGVKQKAIEHVAPEYHNKGEVLANLTLGLRHLEDAAMRFGKVIQSATTGESLLGGPDTPAPIETDK